MAASETLDFTHYLPTSRARSSRHASKAASSSLAGGRAALRRAEPGPMDALVEDWDTLVETASPLNALM